MDPSVPVDRTIGFGGPFLDHGRLEDHGSPSPQPHLDAWLNALRCLSMLDDTCVIGEEGHARPHSGRGGGARTSSRRDRATMMVIGRPAGGEAVARRSPKP